MKRPVTFKHEFVEFVPEELREETLYVSMRFATVAHLCACGCKNKVATPLKPTDWQLVFDGKTISLHPSIGNWNFPCRSHYWIRNNKVRWAADWSQAQVDAGRASDRLAKKAHSYADPENDAASVPGREAGFGATTVAQLSWWKKLWMR